MVNPTIGRIVHYRLSQHDGVRSSVIGEYRPAIVVQTWSAHACNLQVFLDGGNDDSERCTLWRTSVEFGDDNGQWCWPPRTPIEAVPGKASFTPGNP